MKDLEFIKAVDAYLANTADAWQKYTVEDYCHYCRYNCDIFEIYEDAKDKGISDRIIPLIGKMWDDARSE